MVPSQVAKIIKERRLLGYQATVAATAVPAGAR
jgi:hypothetical protein